MDRNRTETAVRWLVRECVLVVLGLVVATLVMLMAWGCLWTWCKFIMWIVGCRG